MATPADHPDRVKRLNNLAGSLKARFERTGGLEDLHTAIGVLREALGATPAGHPEQAKHRSNLAGVLQARFERLGDEADEEAAVSDFAAAAGAAAAPPSLRIEAARDGARLLARADPGRAAGLLEDAVLLPEITMRRLERGDRQPAIGTFAGLAAEAASLVLADPATPAGQRPARALGLLEAGRAVLLSQALETRSRLTDLRAQHVAARQGSSSRS